jgi:predicted amidophosphoribosyltransferase
MKFDIRVFLENLSRKLKLLTTTIVAPHSNASKWQMGFNSAFKGLKSDENYGYFTRRLMYIYDNISLNFSQDEKYFRLPLTLNLLTTTIVALPSNASKWQMGFNSAFKGLKSDENNGYSQTLDCE